MKRESYLHKLASDEFDLLVIGGGITGAGISLDAASRGLKVAMIDMQDFAAGTSSRSTKLIHGGLRYLKQWDFKLVNEVGRERAVLHKLAPHLVHPDKMLLPLIKGGKYGYWLTNVGLSIYDILAGVTGDDRRQMLNREETIQLEPLLKEEVVEGGGFYAEYRTDDARLTLAVAFTAAEKGAVIANYCRADTFIIDQGKVCGITACDLESGSHFQIKAKITVNAAGPWVDILRSKMDALGERRLFLTKGIHLVVSKDRLPIRHTVYFDNVDGRMLFAIPRDEVVYIGTTDTPYNGSYEHPRATAEDALYVLNAVNSMFPSVKLDVEDVISSWAGLRPLIYEEGKGASEMSRRDEIFESENQLISIAGGKLTGYRKMAERVVDRVFTRLGVEDPGCITEKIQLVGGAFQNFAAVSEEKQGLSLIYNDSKLIHHLVNTYGSKAREMLNNRKIVDDHALAIAEAEYSFTNEMAVHLIDHFDRRSGMINFNPDRLERELPAIAKRISVMQGWNGERMEQEMQEVMAELALRREFK